MNRTPAQKRVSSTVGTPYDYHPYRYPLGSNSIYTDKENRLKKETPLKAAAITKTPYRTTPTQRSALKVVNPNVALNTPLSSDKSNFIFKDAWNGSKKSTIKPYRDVLPKTIKKSHNSSSLLKEALILEQQKTEKAAETAKNDDLDIEYKPKSATEYKENFVPPEEVIPSQELKTLIFSLSDELYNSENEVDQSFKVEDVDCPIDDISSDDTNFEFKFPDKNESILFTL